MDEYEKLAARKGKTHAEWFAPGEQQQKKRDRRALDIWNRVLSLNITDDMIVQGESPDFVVNGQPIEITEVLQKGRKRSYEYKDIVDKAKNKNNSAFLKEIDFNLCEEHGPTWIIDRIDNKIEKYNRQGKDTSSWLLIVYANFGIEEDGLDFIFIRDKLSFRNPPFKKVDVLFKNKVETVWESTK